MTRPKPARTVERRIYFFRLNAGFEQGGIPIAFEPGSLLPALDALPYEPVSRGGRKVQAGDGEELCGWVERRQPGSVATHVLALGRLRRDAVPLTELLGRRTPVAIPPNGTLCETSHLAFYPGNLLGAEFNFFAPRASRLSGYLQQALQLEEPPFVAEQILRSDVADRLDDDRGLRVLDLLVRPSYVETVREAERSLGDALAAIRRAGQATEVGVLLKADTRRRSATLGADLMDAARRLARLPALRDNATRFKVKSIDPAGRVHELDLLQDAFVRSQRITVLDPQSRAVDPTSAFAAIDEAYIELSASGALDAAAAQLQQLQ